LQVSENKKMAFLNMASHTFVFSIKILNADIAKYGWDCVFSGIIDTEKAHLKITDVSKIFGLDISFLSCDQRKCFLVYLYNVNTKMTSLILQSEAMTFSVDFTC
jgi:hypothetical protein